MTKFGFINLGGHNILLDPNIKNIISKWLLSAQIPLPHFLSWPHGIPPSHFLFPSGSPAAAV